MDQFGFSQKYCCSLRTVKLAAYGVFLKRLRYVSSTALLVEWNGKILAKFNFNDQTLVWIWWKRRGHDCRYMHHWDYINMTERPAGRKRCVISLVSRIMSDGNAPYIFRSISSMSVRVQLTQNNAHSARICWRSTNRWKFSPKKKQAEGTEKFKNKSFPKKITYSYCEMVGRMLLAGSPAASTKSVTLNTRRC